MNADPILTIAWLVLAHLTADFILQTGAMVAAKSSSGWRAVRGLLAHAFGVGVCLVPVVLAFGSAGMWVLVVITATHVIIDRTKVLVTRRAERRALAAAQRRHEGRAQAAGLGRGWTPLPAAYFALDQAAHLAIIGIAWAIWLAGQAPTPFWAATVDEVIPGRDPAAVHDVVLGVVVLASLLIANARAGAMFVATLVRPIEAAIEFGSRGSAPSDSTPEAAEAGRPRPAGWSFRIGPLAGRVVADPPPAPADTAGVAGERVALPPPAQVRRRRR